MQKIPGEALIVVADGNGARVFRNIGDDRALKLQQQDLLELMNMNDDGPAGAQPQESDIDEATFAKQLAQRLNHGALQGRYAHLVLVADPQTLGLMRPLLHKEVQDRLIGELAKTLTNTPLEGIERALA